MLLLLVLRMGTEYGGFVVCWDTRFCGLFWGFAVGVSCCFMCWVLWVGWVCLGGCLVGCLVACVFDWLGCSLAGLDLRVVVFVLSEYCCLWLVLLFWISRFECSLCIVGGGWWA